MSDLSETYRILLLNKLGDRKIQVKFLLSPKQHICESFCGEMLGLSIAVSVKIYYVSFSSPK